MRASLIVLLMMLSGAAMAADECVWRAGDGTTIQPAPGGFEMIEVGGEATSCSLRGTGTGVPIMAGICGDMSWPYFTIASAPGGDNDILIFMNTAWYRDCRD